MRNNDVYRPVTLDDGKADADAILLIFSAMASGRLTSDLSLLNYYHQVPVSYRTTIQSMDGGNVEFLMHEHQGMAIKNDRHTLIKSAHFPKGLGVHAHAAYTNVQKKTAILHNFSYAQIRAERREAVRVAVNRPLPVTFTFDGGTLNGLMKDISGTGISVLSPDIFAIDGNQTGQLSFTLMDTPILVSGTFVRSFKGSDSSHMCVFMMEPDRKTDAIIGQFSYQRQIEILKDLKEGSIIEDAAFCQTAG